MICVGARGHHLAGGAADQLGHLQLYCCTAFLGPGWADLGGSQPIAVSFLGLAPPWAASGSSWPGKPEPVSGRQGRISKAGTKGQSWNQWPRLSLALASPRQPPSKTLATLGLSNWQTCLHTPSSNFAPSSTTLGHNLKFKFQTIQSTERLLSILEYSLYN